MILRLTLTEMNGTVIGRGKHELVIDMDDPTGIRFATPIVTPEASETELGVMIRAEFV